MPTFSLPVAITEAIEALAILPGVGDRSAERLVLSLLNSPGAPEKKIAQALEKMRDSLTECHHCCNYCQKSSTKNTLSQCELCSDQRRHNTILCVVSSPLDIIAIERTEQFKGHYQVLHGIISPLQQIFPAQLRIEQLLHRASTMKPDEIVLALPSNVDSEATVLYLQQQLQPIFTGILSKIARGIPSGNNLEYLDINTLTQSMLNRQSC